MDNIDEVIDLKLEDSDIDLYGLSKPDFVESNFPTNTAFNNDSICVEPPKQEISDSEENVNEIPANNNLELAMESNESQKKVYRCATCTYQARYISTLRQHEQVHLALDERQLFACEYCNTVCVRKHGLKRHLEFTHFDSRTKESKESQKEVYKCDICGLQTLYRSSLMRHMRVHLEEQQLFACTHCDKKYITKDSLKHHLEIYHIDSSLKEFEKKVYRCDICDFETLHWRSLRLHKVVHLAPEERQLFACAHCNKKYITKHGLKRHLDDNHLDSRAKKLRESQRKVYKCALCSYQTLHNPNLTRHRKLHLAPKERQMFACAQCDNKYMSNQSLHDHITRSHIDFRNADSPTDHVMLDSLKVEIDDFAPLLDDSKNFESLSVTNETMFIKSEDFIKTEPEDVALTANGDMHDDFKNIENLSVTKNVKLEDFMKMEPDDGVLLLDKDTHF